MSLTPWPTTTPGPSATPEAPTLACNAREAARMLSIGTRTLWTLTASGAIPVVRIGRAVRYRRADLEAFLAARMTGGGK